MSFFYVLSMFWQNFLVVKKKLYWCVNKNINTIIGSFEVSVQCGSTDPANLAISGTYPTVVHNDMVIYIPCQNGGEAFFDGFGG